MKNYLPLILILVPLWVFNQNPGFDFSDEAVKHRLYHDIAVLADDSLKGRASGTEQEFIAAGYIAGEFADAGLEMLPQYKSYFQPFMFYDHVKIGKGNLICGDTTFFYRQHYYITQYSASGIAKGEKFRVRDPENIKKSLNNKIALFVLPEAGTKPQNKRHSKKLIKEVLQKIEAKGAEGVILLMRNKGEKFPKIFDYNSDTMSVPVIIMRKAYHDTVISNLPENIEFQVSVKRSKAVKAHNVIGMIDNKANSTVVIGAHYDHVGMGYFGSRSEWVPSVHNGADDNASGTAMIMELARWIKSNGLKNYNYVFIAFGAEERGLYGSDYFCKSCLFDSVNINYMINYDMVGRMRKLRNKLIVMGTGTSDVFRPLLKGSDYKGRMPKFHGAWEGSDHVCFQQNQIPFLYFSTGLHGDYHKPEDDLKKINYKGMMKIFRLSQDVISKLDEMPKIEYTNPKHEPMVKYVSVFLP